MAESARARHPLCPACGHAGSDHRARFGCVEATLDPDGETWLGCPCNLEEYELGTVARLTARREDGQ